MSTHRTSFDTLAEKYRKICTQNIEKFSGADSRYFAAYKIREIRARYDFQPKNWLDLGCGDGLSAIYVNQYFQKTKYYGIDISEDSIAQARKLGDSLNAVFEVYDGKTIPFADESFDVIFMACVVHHIRPSERSRVFKECRRVLKKGGKLIIFEHNTYNPVTCKMARDCIFDQDAILLSEKSLTKQLRQQGFLRIKRRYTIFFPRKKWFQWLIPLEKHLSWCCFGGQYYTVCER